MSDMPTKSVNEMTPTEQMGYWMKICSGDFDFSSYDLPKLSESSDLQTLTIVLKKKPKL